MKHIAIIFLLIFSFITFQPQMISAKDELSALDQEMLNVIPIDRKLKKKIKAQRKSKNITEVKNRNVCADSEFNIKFYCENNWKWRRIKDAIMIVIDVDPTVTLTIKKIDKDVMFLNQITPDRLVGLGLYADGFKTERVDFADQEAIKVKAFSGKYSDVRLANYFYVHNNNLYGALFSVQPKEGWDRQQFVIKKVVDSFTFLN